MTFPSGPIPVQTSIVGVEALIEQARRLGLLQVYRPGTVFQSPTDLTNVLIVLDGDTDPIPVQSLVGGVVAGTRVMVMTVPPQGIYIIGYLGAAGIASVRPIKTILTVGSGDIEETPGAVWYDFEVLGGGGAGGGAGVTVAGQNSKGSGGGAGSYSRSQFIASELTFPLAYVVGAGGTGVSAGNGNTGATSTIDTTLVTAPGGGGGVTVASNAAAGFCVQGGQGGALGTGQFAVRGGGGTIGVGSASLSGSGTGGNSLLGGGAAGRATGAGGVSAGGLSAGDYGGGGGGAYSNSGGGAVSGGNGGDGVIIVHAHFH